MKPVEVESYLKQLSLQTPSPALLREIARIEKGEFPSKLIAAVTRRDQDAVQYITSVVKATYPFCAEILKLHGFPSSIDKIIAVAKSQGPAFFRALNALRTGGDNASLAVTYLCVHFGAPRQQDAGDDPDRLPDFSGFGTARPAAPRAEETGEAAPVRGADALPDFDTFQPHQKVHEAGAASQLERTRETQVGVADRSRQAATARTNNVMQLAPVHADAPNQSANQIVSTHIYGVKGALCFSECLSTDQKIHTVRVEAAPKVNGKSVWATKIGINLTISEIYKVLAVLHGKLLEVILDGHGAAHDKTFSIERQETNFFIKMQQRNRAVIAVPISAEDSIPLDAMLTKQIQRNYPHLDVNSIGRQIDNMVGMISAAATSGTKRRTA
jgi:hypothetical protein